MKIAVILPCYNEEVAIGQTIAGFQAVLPTAEIVVCDNNSSDRTTEVARAAGARVVFEPRPGKGEAVRRLFSAVDADVYVMADGDATYDPDVAPDLVRKLVDEDLDMVVGNRLHTQGSDLFRSGHRLGNRMFSLLVQWGFGRGFEDLLSGYRVFSRRFVRTFPSSARGFEIETELTVHALEHRLPVGEVVTRYLPRPEGSVSKLSTYKDGLRILVVMGLLFRDVRPLAFFTGVSLITASIALGLFWPVYLTFLQTGLVPRIPTVVLVTGMFIYVGLLLTSGIILDRFAALRRTTFRYHYQRESGPGQLDLDEHELVDASAQPAEDAATA